MRSPIWKLISLQLICLIATSSLFSFTKAQAQYGKDGDDEDETPADYTELIEIAGADFESKVMKAKEGTIFFMQFQEPDDKNSKLHASQLSKVAKHFDGTIVVARIFCNKAFAVCKRMQVLGEGVLPVWRIIDNSKVYSYEGDVKFDAIREHMESKAYETTEDALLHMSLEKYIAEGDKKSIPKPSISKDQKIPRSVVETPQSFPSILASYTPGPIMIIGNLFNNFGTNKVARFIPFVGKFSILGRNICVFFMIVMPLSIAISGMLINCCSDRTDPAPALVPAEQAKQSTVLPGQLPPKVMQVPPSNDPATLKAQREWYIQQAAYYKAQAAAAETYVKAMDNYQAQSSSANSTTTQATNNQRRKK